MKLPQVPEWGPYGERHPFPEPSSTHPPSLFTQQDPYRDRCSVSRASGLFIYICQNPQLRNTLIKWGKTYNLCPQSPTVDGRLTYHGVLPCYPRGSFTTLLSLPQCHAAFSTIPSIWAWIDQSPVSQRVVVTLNSVSPPYLLPPPTWPRVQIHITLSYGRGVGFMGGWQWLNYNLSCYTWV